MFEYDLQISSVFVCCGAMVLTAPDTIRGVLVWGPGLRIKYWVLIFILFTNFFHQKRSWLSIRKLFVIRHPELSQRGIVALN